MPLVILPEASDAKRRSSSDWGQAMDWKSLLFSFEGRINRAKYWLAVLIFAVVYVVVGIFVALLMTALGQNTALIVGGLVGLAALVFGIWAGLAVGVKRLHDREKTGWWLLVFWLLPGVIGSAGSAIGGLAGGILSLASLALSIWAIVELGCLKGTTGQNKYGPDPLPPEPA